MGEYANLNGQRIKIGTCENMYYLRADQRDSISGYRFDADTLDVVRFRFPFPDEDDIEPGGDFKEHSRGVRIPGYSLPEELSGDTHGSVQFTSPAGYVLSVPCPEQYGQAGLSVELPGGFRVGRNGFNGGPVVRQQAFRGEHLVTLVSCGACGALCRLDTLKDAQSVIEAFRAEAVREEWRRKYDYERAEYLDEYGFEPVYTGDSRAFYLAMADRIEAGYAVATADFTSAR